MAAGALLRGWPHLAMAGSPAAAAAAATFTVLACCCAAQDAAEPALEPVPQPEPEPQSQPQPEESDGNASDSSDSSEEGRAMMSLFDGSDDDSDLESQLPPAKILAHERSGVQLRAFGMEFGHTTGLALWPAASITAESFMGDGSGSGARAIDVAGLSVLELGAGLALPSIVAAKFGGARCVVSTDYPDELQLANISHNAALNLDATQAAAFHVAGHLWGDPVAPLLALNGGKGFDIVVLTDLIYKSSLHAELLKSASDCLAPSKCVSPPNRSNAQLSTA